ncbi:MAG: IclR family transcriptional regulator [Ideonella sp.]|nr:IclR family transcriptional regulator [Ideonella sp.]MCC7459045.1 IclR family transcriptional regulator [Nitrospira sp.]
MANTRTGSRAARPAASSHRAAPSRAAPSRAAASRSAPKPRARRGIQSVEVGGRLLHALAHHGRAMALKDLAAEAGMTAAKAHPYLVSFGHIGLVRQDSESGRYALGPLVLQLGLISLQQADPVRLAAPLLADLAARTGHTVALVVWGGRGPTVVLREASPAPVHVDLRHGTVFSIAGTASGRLFAAHLPAVLVRPVYEAERTQVAAPLWPRFVHDLAEVHRHGLGRADEAVLAGVSALSAPVFDHGGAMVLAITAIGPSAAFDSRWGGAVAVALREAAHSVSAQLGHREGRRSAHDGPLDASAVSLLPTGQAA